MEFHHVAVLLWSGPALALFLFGCSEPQTAVEIASGIWEVDVATTDDSLMVTTTIEDMNMELSIVGPQKLEGTVFTRTVHGDLRKAVVECFALQEPEEGGAMMRCRDTSPSRDLGGFVGRVFEWEEGRWSVEIEPGAFVVMEYP